MTPRRWLFTTTLLIVAAGMAIVGVNVTIDPYGLFRPTKGRRLVVYGDPRVAKYLLNGRYVPENFDAVLIGSSVSANWDMSRVAKLRIYNDSLDGGNIVEGRLLLDRATSRPGIATVLLLVHPSLTASHDYKTVELTADLTRSAVGSLSLWEAYKDMMRVRLHRTPAWGKFDDAGTEALELASEMNAVMKALWRPGDTFDLDPVAFAAYRDTVRHMRAKRLQMIFIVPPTFEDLLQSKRRAFDSYVRLIRADSTPDDIWIDFTADRYRPFRSHRAHFPDGSHLNAAAAEMVVTYINTEITEWRAQGSRVAAPQSVSSIESASPQ